MRSQINKTKIVATVGPASSSKQILKDLIFAGVNVFRINFSHGTQNEHLSVINLVRELNEELQTNVAVLADLQGPKLRIGEVENNQVLLNDNAEVTFVTKKCIGTASQLYMSYKKFPEDVKKGDVILIDDGKIKLEAIESNGIDTVLAKVIQGGVLSSRKGVNLPNTAISLPSLTDKDIEDATFAIDNNVDWLALSFVRSAQDIVILKETVSCKSKCTKVIAKIEKPEALVDIDNIIEIADGVMVARGDLGVEMPFNQVPLIQKKIVEKCIGYAKPVIIATQMLESMINSTTPTRAEANDVANAVIDGASAVMLSAETSVGKYPVEVINAMKSIICYTEDHGYNYDRNHSPEIMAATFIPDSTCRSACKLAKQTNAKAIVIQSFSGYTAFRIASHRPNASLFAFTPDKDLLRQMSLLWGIRAYSSKEFLVAEKAIDFTIQTLRADGQIHVSDVLVHVGSMPLNKKGRTNMVKLTQVTK